MGVIIDGGFARMKLSKGFKVPKTIDSIGDYAFYETEENKNFKFPSNPTTMGLSIFKSAIIKGGFTMDGLSWLAPGMFSKAILPKDFSIPSSVTLI